MPYGTNVQLTITLVTLNHRYKADELSTSTLWLLTHLRLLQELTAYLTAHIPACCTLESSERPYSTDIYPSFPSTCKPQILSTIFSDKASTYHSTVEELLKPLKSPMFQTNLSKCTAEWKFIRKRAPWHYGFWGRLIGLTNFALIKGLERENIRLSKLQAIVTEIEATSTTVPSHFLSNVDDEQLLIASHLHYGRRTTALPNLAGLIQDFWNR